MAIGKIDCTVHKALCKEYRVRGYPTLKFSLDGDVEDYPGSRDEDSIIAFATKMSSPSVKTVATYDQAIEFASRTEEGVAFLGYDPTSTLESPSKLYQVFSQVARKKQAAAYFYWLEGEQGEAFVHRIESDVKPKVWDKTDLTAESLSKFVQEQNIPLVAKLGPRNFHKIGNNGRHLVVSVVDVDNEDQYKAVKAHMIDYISQAKNPDQYYYGMIDGKTWGKFLEQFRVNQADNPQTIILDVPTKTFWQNETYSDIFEFMKAVEDGTLAPDHAKKGSRASGVLGMIERAFLDYFPYSLAVPLLLVCAFVLFLVPSEQDFTQRYDPEEKDEILEEESDNEEETEGDDGKLQESKKDK